MISLNIEIDDEALKQAINDSLALEDNEQIFAGLAASARAKAQLQDAIEVIDKLEAEAKSLINAKANELFGVDWQPIVGQWYKILKSPTGSVYTRIPDVPVQKKFLKIKEDIDSKKVEQYLDENGKLPRGIDFNPQRGFSIRISLKDKNDADSEAQL